MGVLDAFRPRGATWSGQVISSTPGPSGGPSKTHLLPGGGVPRVHRARSRTPPRLPLFATPRSVHQFAAVAAGAYPPRRPPNAWSPGVRRCRARLLACRQWDPLGLARWLPSLGVGAWRSAPLLPGRVQCPVRVCAALAAGSGGSRRYLVLCLPLFPLPAPRVPRCVWRAVPSGCPLSSLADTPFNAVCAFRELGPAALLVVPACPLCVCALALLRRPLPPPPLGCVACAPRAVSALGAGRIVRRGPCPSACPAPVPCTVWRAWGGAARSRCPPTGLGVVRPPRGGSAHPGRSCAGGWGGGGGACAAPPVCAAGGASGAGGRSASFRPSAFPGQATKRVSLASFWSWRAWPQYRSGWCSPAFSGRVPCGVLARWRGFAGSPRFLWEPAAGAGGRAVLRPLSRAPRSRRGEGVSSPLPRGGGGRRPRGLRAGGGVGGGGSPAVPYPAPPLVVGAFPPACAFGRGRGAAPCTGCGLPGGGGGEEGRPVDCSPGGPFRPETSLCPPRVGYIVVVTCDALVMGGAAPMLFWCAVACRPRAWSARRSGALVRARRSAATRAGAGGWGRWGARCVGPAAPPPPPPASRSLLGEGGRPLGSWGVGGRRSCGPQAGGQAGGERRGAGRGGRSAVPRPPAPSGVGLPSFVSGAPPRGYTRAVGVTGRPWVSGAARSAANGSVRRGGGRGGG